MSAAVSADVAVIGIGAMGLPIARRLAALGHRVAVRDVDPAREALAAGCRVATSAADAARGAALAIVAVVDAAQIRAVLFDEAAGGAASALAPGAAVMLCPTIAPEDTAAIAERLGQTGLVPIDAPMSGGPARAADGTMSLMVACTDAAFARWQPLLAQMASRLVRVGTRPGDGARTKLVNNLLAAVNLAGAAEALALARALGLDPATTLGVIEQSSGQSWIGSDRLRRALAGDERVLARVALLAKDSRLALEAAASAGFEAPVGRAAALRFARAVEAGLADADDAALLRLAGG